MATKKAPAKKAPAKPAAKKAAGKAPAKKVSRNEGVEPGKELVSYDEMIARLSQRGVKEAEREAATGAGGTPFMNTEGKNFHIAGDDGEEFGDSIQCVVIATSFFNAWYDSPYVRGESNVPACYAVAEEEEDLAPPDDVPDRQADTCAECPLNEFGSADNGTGKACGNRRKLAILLLSDLEEGIVRPLQLSLPPTALKHWGRYVKAVARQHKTSFAGVVTRFDFDEDNPQPCPVPTFEGMVDKDLLASVFHAIPEGEEIVMAKVNTDDYVSPAEKAKARKGAGKLGRKGAAAKKAPAKKAAKSARGGSGKQRRR